MKKLLLACAFIGFLAISNFATTTVLSTSFDTVLCDDGKNCDKKDCKHNKKTCEKGDKKAHCSKDKAKKAHCSKDKAKKDKAKASSKKKVGDVKKEALETK